MKYSENLTNLAAALKVVQLHITPVVKDSRNPHFNSTFASLDGIMESVRPLLAGHGLCIVQGGGSPVSNAEGNVVGISVETMLLHESGEYITSSIVLPVERPSPQTIGSAITYGRRYGVAAVLALATEDDDDGSHATAVQANSGASRSVAVPVGNLAGPVQTATAPTPALATPSPTCPICDGPMYDDRTSKKNPAAPDFKCKNKPKALGGPGCKGVIWPTKEAVNAVPFRPGDEPPHPADDERAYA